MRRHPAEWENQESILLAWPRNEFSWGPRLGRMQQFTLDFIQLALEFQPVRLLVPPDQLAHVETRVPTGKYPLHIHAIPTDDVWVRDYGPFLLEEDGKPLCAEFSFNAWGAKFPPWDMDNAIPTNLARLLTWPLESHSPILEGGAMEFDGQGNAMTTLDCLIGETRNPEASLDDLEEEICHAFGLSNLLVISQGIAGDHTDGHIDNLARFLAPGHVLLPVAAKDDEENQRRISEATDLLSDWDVGPCNTPLVLHHLPMPPQRRLGEEVLPASYANFVFLNGAVVVPLYDCPHDATAMDFFRNFYPDRKIIGMDCRLVIEEGGSLHCMSKQLARIP